METNSKITMTECKSRRFLYQFYEKEQKLNLYARYPSTFSIIYNLNCKLHFDERRTIKKTKLLQLKTLAFSSSS